MRRWTAKLALIGVFLAAHLHRAKPMAWGPGMAQRICPCATVADGAIREAKAKMVRHRGERSHLDVQSRHLVDSIEDKSFQI
ncbi:MAG: hypothetical protein ACJAVR_000892 [Paracoccaceae bacterium]